MKRRGAVLLFAVVAAVGLYMVPAGATGSHGWRTRILVVDKDSHRGSCYGKHHRPFRTIQAAVDAADPATPSGSAPASTGRRSRSRPRT